MQRKNPFLLCFMTDPDSLLSSQASRAGLCTLKTASSPPSHKKALLSAAYLSP